MARDTRQLVITAMFAALTVVATMIRFISGPHGYYHVGDGLFFTAALLLGPRPGALAGALGGGIADLLSGYAIWAPITAVIKGVSGWAVGRLGHGDRTPARILGALAAGSAVIVVGYAVATAAMYGWPAVLPETVGNLFQTGIGIALALILRLILRRALPYGS